MSFLNIFTFKSKIIKIDIVNTIKKSVNSGAMVDMFWKSNIKHFNV